MVRRGRDSAQSEADALARLPRRIQHRLERGARAGRELHFSERRHLHAAASRRTSLFTVNRAKFLPQPRVGVAWSPFGERRSSARASACTTICRMRWVSRGSERALQPDLHDRRRPVANLNLPINPAAHRPASRWAGAGRRAARHVHADAGLVLVEDRAAASRRTRRSASAMSAATAITKSSAWTRMHPLRWFVRRRRARRRIPATFSRWGAGRTAGAGRDLFHPTAHDESQTRARQYLDVGFRRRQHVQRAAGGSEPPLQRGTVAAGRVYLVEDAGRWRLAECHGGDNAVALLSNPFNLRAIGGRRPMTSGTPARSTRFMLCRSAAAAHFLSSLERPRRTAWSADGR